MSFIYPIYNHNWRNISTIIYITRLASNEIFSPSKKIHREVGRAKDLSAPRYILFIIIIGGILVLFIYITRLASNETFSPSNEIHREVGQAKDLSAPLYCATVGKNIINK